MRRKLSTLGATTLLAVTLLAGGSATPAHASVTKVVKMTNSLTFMPMNITIHKGDSIKWKNVSSSGTNHTSTSSSWNSGTVAPGGHFVHRFRSVGTFKYHCQFH